MIANLLTIFYLKALFISKVSSFYLPKNFLENFDYVGYDYDYLTFFST
jgi:hypothetical protein